MSEPINQNGELLLPVCIPESEITHLFGALDLYRVLKNEGKSYPAFDAVASAIEFIDNPQDSPCLDCDCDDNNGACFRMDTTTEIFDFYPNNPFDSSDNNTTLLGTRWTRFQDVVNYLDPPKWLFTLAEYLGIENAGYFPNDCFIDLNIDQNIFELGENFWQSVSNAEFNPFPTVTIRLQGTGQVEIEFPQVPFGGGVLVAWDFNPTIQNIVDIVNGDFEDINNFQLLELSRDVIGIPPELVPTTILEIDFTEDIEHTIQCFFTPAIQPDTPPFVFPFAGIREVEFCGNLTVIGAETGTQYDQLNYGIAAASRKGIIMSTVEDICAGVVCALEKVSQRILLASDSDNIENNMTIDRITGSNILQPKTFGFQDLSALSQDKINGGAYGVASGFRDMLQTVESASQESGATAEGVAAVVSALYSVNTNLVLGAITNYMANRPSDVTNFGLSSLTEDIYDAGGAMVGVSRWAFEETSGFLRNTVIEFSSIVDEAQRQLWFNNGSNTPRGDWRDYSSNRLQAREFSFDFTEAQSANYKIFSPYNLPGVNPRLLRIEVSGDLDDGAGKTFDGSWLDDNGVLQVNAPDVRMDVAANLTTGGAAPVYSVGGLPEYNQFASGNIYAYNGLMTQSGETFLKVRMNSVIRAIAWTSGQVNIKIIDLGDNA